MREQDCDEAGREPVQPQDDEQLTLRVFVPDVVCPQAGAAAEQLPQLPVDQLPLGLLPLTEQAVDEDGRVPVQPQEDEQETERVLVPVALLPVQADDALAEQLPQEPVDQLPLGLVPLTEQDATADGLVPLQPQDDEQLMVRVFVP